jgi:hypothetical protein
MSEERALDDLHTVKVRMTSGRGNLVGAQSRIDRSVSSKSSAGLKSPMRRVEERV